MQYLFWFMCFQKYLKCKYQCNQAHQILNNCILKNQIFNIINNDPVLIKS